MWPNIGCLITAELRLAQALSHEYSGIIQLFEVSLSVKPMKINLASNPRKLRFLASDNLRNTHRGRTNNSLWNAYKIGDCLLLKSLPSKF